MKQSYQIHTKLKLFTILLLSTLFLCFSQADSFAKRRCNTKRGKAQALKLLSSDSTLARLAHLEYQPFDSLSEEERKRLTNDSEVLTDIDTTDVANEKLDSIEWSDEQLSMEVFEDDFMEHVNEFGEEANLTYGGLSKQELMNSIMEWVGTRYRFGGMSKRGVDCSALMQKFFVSAADIKLPRTARYQHKVGEEILDMKYLRFGDLVFFNTRRRVRVSHVGMYLGNNLFVHASSRYGVTVSSLESTYYKKRFLGGKRISSLDVSYVAKD
jgi:hypothetical protein